MKDAVEVYSQIAKSIPPWTSAEEREFVRSCVRSGKWKSNAAKERFVCEAMKRNLNLVFKLVNTHSFKKNDEDIIQRAVIAMVEALKKFNPASKNKISTWIQQPIVWSIKQTQHTYYKGNAIAEQISALNRRYNLKMSVVSVDAKVSRDGDPDSDTIGDLISVKDLDRSYFVSRNAKSMDESIHDHEVQTGVRQAVKSMHRILDKRELYVVNGLLGGKNMREISDELHLSRMRISQISAKAFEKIRSSSIGRTLKAMLKG